MTDISIKLGDRLLTKDGTAIVTDFVFNKYGGLKALEVETPKYHREHKKECKIAKE